MEKKCASAIPLRNRFVSRSVHLTSLEYVNNLLIYLSLLFIGRIPEKMVVSIGD